MKCRTVECNELAKYDGYCGFCIGKQWIACKTDKCEQLTLHESGFCFFHRGDLLLSAGEVSTMLGVSPKTVQRLADSGRLPCVNTEGGHRRFQQEAVKKLLQERQDG